MHGLQSRSEIGMQLSQKIKVLLSDGEAFHRVHYDIANRIEPFQAGKEFLLIGPQLAGQRGRKAGPVLIEDLEKVNERRIAKKIRSRLCIALVGYSAILAHIERNAFSPPLLRSKFAL